MSSPLGLMAPTIIDSDAVQGETFLPGQIFVFGGFALRANSLGHLEQIESYAPGHQVRFGSLNYTANIRGDLIFEIKDRADAGAASRGVAFDLLQMAKRIGSQSEAAEGEDLSGEKSLTLDLIAVDD